MKCKPGDIAFITQRIPENVGKLVLVVELFGEVDYSHLGLGKLPSWSVESMGGSLKEDTGRIVYGGHIPDLALHPIGETTLTRKDLAQARAEAELEAAWENLREVAREMAREETLAEFETPESNQVAAS
ncbi:MAG: hypothetical protein MUE59_00050 [Thiobacillaceae bacterium]|nr:hypothetical protein [Thiobacillaceae bacterium]